MALHGIHSPAAASSPRPILANVTSPRVASAPSAVALLRQPPATTVSCCRGALLNKYALSSGSNYVALGRGTSASLYSRPIRKCTSWKRAISPRCATTEEINAHKSSVEKSAKEKMDKSIEALKATFNSVRTGRANPAMLDKIEVEYYGTPVSLKSIAQISVPNATSLLVQPFDKSMLKVIEKALHKSYLGLTPSDDGEVIRLTFPPMTEDRRKELTKLIGKHAEDGKVAIRSIRREALKAYEKLEKEKKLSKDNVKDLQSDFQILTDEYVKKVESLRKEKEKELLTL